jgi:hypothetical protein
LSWQIEPKLLRELSTASDKEKRDFAMNVMFKMQKIIIKDLKGGCSGIHFLFTILFVFGII